MGLALLLTALALSAYAAQVRGQKTPIPFNTPLTLEQMTNKQAVVNTAAGTFVIDFRPDLAPNHVGYFNDTKHLRGIVSMARGDDPASATTSFFIVTGDAPSLDGKYTVFGRVVDGMSVVDAIEQSPVSGETPVARIDLKAVRIVK